MANELSVSATLTFGTAGVSRAGGGQYDVAGTWYAMTIVNADVAALPLLPGGASTLGYLWCRNVDTVTDIRLRVGAAGADFILLKPNDVALCRIASRDIYLIADAPASGLEYLVIEE